MADKPSTPPGLRPTLPAWAIVSPERLAHIERVAALVSSWADDDGYPCQRAKPLATGGLAARCRCATLRPSSWRLGSTHTWAARSAPWPGQRRARQG